ncbi:MAG: alpha/beta hydrolase [Pseudomonadota bacterium]
MPKLEANGLQIEYDAFGNTSDDALLLIMGLGTQMTAWSVDFCETLAAHGHYVVRFDNRDIGLSTKFEGAPAPSRARYLLHQVFGVPIHAPYSLDDMADDAAGVLDALGIEAAHIVGASMGGMIAQLMTVNHPQRVRTLTSLMSSSGDPRLPSARPDLVRHILMNRPNNNDTDAILDHMTKSLMLLGGAGYPRDESELRAFASAALERSFYPKGFTRQMAAIVADGSRVQRLKTISTPTLVIHGDDDPLVPVECGIDTAKHIDGARLEIIDGMGHDLPPQLIATLTSMIADHTANSLVAERPKAQANEN